MSCARRSGVPTSVQAPRYTSPLTSPRSMAARSIGARGTATPSGLPAGAGASARVKKLRLYKATVLKVYCRPASPAGRLSTAPSAARPKSPLRLCVGLGTSHKCACLPLAAKRCTASCVNTKSGANTSPAATQNTSSSCGKARTMPPAVSSAWPKSRPSCE